jgi:hypothetical protein
MLLAALHMARTAASSWRSCTQVVAQASQRAWS